MWWSEWWAVLMMMSLGGAALLPLRRRPMGEVRTLVVLGSGGHTTEMLRLTAKLDRARYRVWMVVAATDTTSMPKALATPGFQDPEAWLTVPRAREVGQGWLSTCFSTCRALVACVALVVGRRPHLVIANGPGTCLPVCAAARLLCGSRLIFCESWCRVQDLSMTGKLIYPFSHRFLVHWPRLRDKYPRAEYIGQLC